MEIKRYRTVSLRIKPGNFTQALDSMQLAAKNLKNMGLFLVKNVLSSFDCKDKVYTIKPLAELHPNQIEALAAANAAAAACNATRAAKNKEKRIKLAELEAELAVGKIGDAEFEAKKKPLKESKLFADFMGAEANPWAILDDGLLDKLMRTRKDQNGNIPFEALPAKAAEQVRMQVGSEFKSWTKSLKAHAQSPGKFKGRPQMPKYMGKNDRLGRCVSR